MGNTIVFLFAYALYYLEADINNKLNGFIDALWWAFSTVTTVGYGDVNPVTDIGKIMGIILMLIGTALFATYTALFANALLGFQLYGLDYRIRHLQEDIDDFQHDVKSKNPSPRD